MSARKPQARFGWHGQASDSKAIEVGDCVSEVRSDGLALIGGEVLLVDRVLHLAFVCWPGVEDHTWHNFNDLRIIE